MLLIGGLMAVAVGLGGCSELPGRGYLSNVLFGDDNVEPPPQVVRVGDSTCQAVARQRADDVGYLNPGLRDEVFARVLKTCTDAPGFY